MANKRLPYTKNLHVKQAYSENLTIVDAIAIFGTLLISVAVGKFLLSNYVWYFFVIACTVIMYLLVSPSGEYGKKNYQKIITVMFKKRVVYHSINRPKTRWWR